MLPNVKVGIDCTIRNAILDEGCEVPSGMKIGFDSAADSQRFHVTGNGVALHMTLPAEMLDVIVKQASAKHDAHWKQLHQRAEN